MQQRLVKITVNGERYRLQDKGRGIPKSSFLFNRFASSMQRAIVSRLRWSKLSDMEGIIALSDPLLTAVAGGIMDSVSQSSGGKSYAETGIITGAARFIPLLFTPFMSPPYRHANHEGSQIGVCGSSFAAML